MSQGKVGDTAVFLNNVKKRKRAGIMSLIVGIPNFILAVLMTFGGIALSVILGFIVYGLLNDSGGDDPWKELCIVLILILFIGLLIAAVVFTLISLLFAMGVGGQTIGGWYALKGRHYIRSLVLTMIGSVVSLLAGLCLLGVGVLGDLSTSLRVVTIAFGVYEIASSGVTLTSFIMLLGTKETFSKPKKKKKKDKKRSGPGKKKK
ncbi:MAG: hypothetical protein JXA22_04305 [Candidatus Thermoplasmatota archaeon]|nr:hypothetical protein [Candidatus Thermoplasmatota archaeon]